MNEHTAIKFLKQGDPKGLEFLVKKYQLTAVRAAYLIVRDRSAAEDIVQSAFIRVYKRIHQFDQNRPFRPWFLKIVTNDAVKLVTRGNRQIPIDFDDSQAIGSIREFLTDSILDPEGQAEKVEMRQKIWDAMAKISPEQRAAIVMHYYLDFSIAEISQKTDSPQGTIKWRLHAARKRLREILQPINLD
jgi:RNA polymerase sigma-70 factor (ECF subfamily)